MIIRKLFKFEGAHRVFNCSSNRCKYSDHGHSYIVEVFFTSEGLDNGQMVVDFGLMKGTLKEFIDSFDHAYSMWANMPLDQKTFHKKNSDRWIEMPVSPSAEAYALMFFFVIDKIMDATEFNNGEKKPMLSSVRVHETATGYAEAFRSDLEYLDISLHDIIFSDGVKSEWKDPFWYYLLQNREGNAKVFINPTVEQQV